MMLLEFYLEEPSAEAALVNLVPKILPDYEFDYEIYTFQGKRDLLKNLPNRLKAYQHWITEQLRIIILVDRDDDDCEKLKTQLETIAQSVGLSTRSSSPAQYNVINRIAIEELEAWFFGDVDAMRAAYPKVPVSVAKQKPYRNPDLIKGGTWEHLERLLKDYHPGGLEKVRASEDISQYMIPELNRSKSFQVFRDALKDIFIE